jgi:uncharacterized pyridoxamine 5'-phosphate oxidase family protein
MHQVEISYAESKERIAQLKRKCPRLYLATSAGDCVTARIMGFVSDGLRIWFVTDDRSRKVQQTAANPNVAIAGGDALQIVGVASLRGHPLDEQNAEYIRVLERNSPEQFERGMRPGRLLQRQHSCVIEVSSRRIMLTIWTPNWDLETDFQPHALILNVPQE